MALMEETKDGIESPTKTPSVPQNGKMDDNSNISTQRASQIGKFNNQMTVKNTEEIKE